MIKLARVRNRQTILILLIAVFLIAMIVGAVFTGRAINPHIKDFGTYGYLGAFLLGLIMNASVLVPVPIIVTPLLTGLATEYDPYSIAVAYALGATFGESVSYGAGSVIVARIIGRIRGIRERTIANDSFYSQVGRWLGKYSGLTMLREEQDRKEGFYQRLVRWFRTKTEKWLKKYGGWAIFVLAIQPVFPFDVAGIVAGAAKYPYYKFLIFCFAGRIIKYIVMIGGGIELWRLIFH